jgi:type III restriction enzyme
MFPHSIGNRRAMARCAKREALGVWVQAVNAKGGFGSWCCDVAFEPAQIHDIVNSHAG